MRQRGPNVNQVRPANGITVSAEQAELLSDLWKGRFDVAYFATHILGLDINHAQKRWFKYINPAADGWSWRVKIIAHVAGNQIGKSLGLAVIIIWACWYKIGVPIDNQTAWTAHSYNWFHVAPSQSQAYIPLDDALKLVRGEHEAQRRPCRLPKGLVVEAKADIYYRSLEFRHNGAVAQFRTTEEKAKALQGKRAAGISADECAFEDHFIEVVNEVLMMRLISTGGPFFPVSTPNGINDWFEYVQAIIDDSPAREVAEEGDPMLGGWAKAGQPLPVWLAANDSAVLVWSAVEDNVGFGISVAEWQRMEQTLSVATKEQQLRGAFLEPAEAFFVPSEQIERAFRRNLPAQALPLPGHVYAIGWDPSMTSDPTVVIVLDITKKPWRGVYFERWVKPMGDTLLLHRMHELHALYSGGAMKLKPGESAPRAKTIYDATSMGGAMLRQSLRDLNPKQGINLAGPNMKNNLLTNLRAALSQGDLILPRAWLRVMREVLTYKLPDNKIVQDCVMALVLPADAAARNFGGQTVMPFRIRH